MSRPAGAMRPPHFPRLAARIAELGWTHGTVANQCGITAGSVSGIVRGQLAPSAALRARMADVLDVPEDELFQLDPDVARLVDLAVAQGLGRTVSDPNVLRRISTLTRQSDAQPA